MATSFKIPSGGSDSWKRTTDSDKIQSAPNTNDSVKELFHFYDNYDDDPTVSRLTIGAGGILWNSYAKYITSNTGGGASGIGYYSAPGQIADVTIQATLRPTEYNLGAEGCAICLRMNSSTGAHYRAIIYDDDLYLQYYSAWHTYTSTLNAVVLTRYNKYNVKFEIIGTALKVKAWKIGVTEPGAWNIEETDATLSTGYVGVAFQTVTTRPYIDNFQIVGDIPTTKPVIYTHFDTGQVGTVIANGAELEVLANVRSTDAGEIKCKLCAGEITYDGTGGDSDCNAVDALVNDSWLTIDGNNKITVPAEMTGRYVNVVYQFNTNDGGTHQTSLADCGEALVVTLSGGSLPGTPEMTSLTAGDTEVVVTLTADDEADVVYARYRLPDGDWAAESETFKRTGSGDITITGLTNGQRYQIGIYAKSGDLTSDWDFGWCVPTDGSNDPAGMISLPLHYLRKMVSESVAFQDWVEAADASEALARIYKVSTNTFTLPFVVVDWADNYRRAFVAGGARHHFMNEGDLVLVFWGAIDPEHSDSEAADVFLNKIGAIFEDIEELAGTGGYLGITGISLTEGPHRAGSGEKKVQGEFYEAVYTVEYR